MKIVSINIGNAYSMNMLVRHTLMNLLRIVLDISLHIVGLPHKKSYMNAFQNSGKHSQELVCVLT